MIISATKRHTKLTLIPKMYHIRAPACMYDSSICTIINQLVMSETKLHCFPRTYNNDANVKITNNYLPD